MGMCRAGNYTLDGFGDVELLHAAAQQVRHVQR
jgi:hypothetical protein